MRSTEPTPSSWKATSRRPVGWVRLIIAGAIFILHGIGRKHWPSRHTISTFKRVLPKSPNSLQKMKPRLRPSCSAPKENRSIWAGIIIPIRRRRQTRCVQAQPLMRSWTRLSNRTAFEKGMAKAIINHMEQNGGRDALHPVISAKETMDQKAFDRNVLI